MAKIESSIVASMMFRIFAVLAPISCLVAVVDRPADPAPVLEILLDIVSVEAGGDVARDPLANHLRVRRVLPDGNGAEDGEERFVGESDVVAVGCPVGDRDVRPQ